MGQPRAVLAEGAAPVVDPIFGRDIGFFLFELPFLRLVQGAVQRDRPRHAPRGRYRYLVAATAGSSSSPRRSGSTSASSAGCSSCRSPSATSSTSSSSPTAPGASRPASSYTDQNAQFFAFDVLTVLSGLAGRAPRRRRVHPDAVAAGPDARRLVRSRRWSSVGLPRGDPAVHRRPQPVRAGGAVHRQQHRDDPARVRARPTGRTPAVPRRSRAHARPVSTNEAARSGTPACGTTGRSATRSTSSRRSGGTTTSSTSIPTATIDGEQRQVMLSARELALEQNPGATGWVNQRVVFTHGIGAAMVPVNEVGHEGQPRLFIGNLPPVSAPGAPTITQPRIYFGERPTSYVVVGAQTERVRLPDRRGRRGRLERHRDPLDRDDRDPPRHDAQARCCSRCASATSTC